MTRQARKPGLAELVILLRAPLLLVWASGFPVAAAAGGVRAAWITLKPPPTPPFTEAPPLPVVTPLLAPGPTAPVVRVGPGTVEFAAALMPDPLVNGASFLGRPGPRFSGCPEVAVTALTPLAVAPPV